MYMPSSVVSALAILLDGRYRVTSPSPDLVVSARAVPERDTVPLRRRKRYSALDPYRGIAEAFIRRRARARDRSIYTYERLARLIERKSKRRFTDTTIQRRMVVWGLVDGMERYKK
jgi:hypothetical protein